MPQEIGRDDEGVTYRRDDGSTFTIPWDALVKMGGVSVEDAAYRIEGKRERGAAKDLDVSRERLREQGKDPGQDPFRGFHDQDPLLEEIFGRRPAAPASQSPAMPPWEQYPRQSPNEVTHVPQASGEPRVLKQLERNPGDLAMRDPRAEDKGYSQSLLSTPGVQGTMKPPAAPWQAEPRQDEEMTVQPDVLPSTPEERLADARARETDAIHARGDSEAAARAAEAAGTERLADMQGRDAKQMDAMRQQASTEHRKEMAKLGQDIETLRNTNIDPSRWWKSRSTGQKIAAGVQLALAGFLSGVEGVTQASNLISEQINRDLQAQQADLAGKWDALRAQAGIVDANRQARTDDQTAFAAVKAMLHAKEADKIRAQGMNLRSPQARADAEVLASQVEANGQKDLIALDRQREEMKLKERALEIDAYQARSGRISAGASASNARTARMATTADIAYKGAELLNETLGIGPRSRAAQAQVAKLDEKQRERAVYGFDNKTVVGLTPTKEEAIKVREKMTAYRQAREGLIRLREMSEEFGRRADVPLVKRFNSAERTRMDSLYNQLLANYARSISGAQTSDREAERLARVILRPATILSADASASYDEFLRSLDEGAKTSLGELGITYDPGAEYELIGTNDLAKERAINSLGTPGRPAPQSRVPSAGEAWFDRFKSDMETGRGNFR